MTESAARIIAAVVAIGVVCCAVALIAPVHLPDEDSGPGTGNVTPEGSLTGSDQSRNVRNEEEHENATHEQVPAEVREDKDMTPEEISRDLYASIYGPRVVKEAL